MNRSKFENSSAATAVNVEAPATGSAEYLNYLQSQKQTFAGPDSMFLAADEKMIRIKEIIEQIASANVPVLITGESGTGKEVVAKAIHQASNRAQKPFVAVNCAALPSSLLESELFGFERGSFTGAHQRHVGKFEQASGGTLLLDEVTEMDPGLQAKLLRALQEKEIERIGGSGPIAVDTRVIATTNRDILSNVAKGTFRQDLYYRLYVIHIEVPALRERIKDIELLARNFLTRFGEQFGKPNLSFTPDALAKLQAYSWPGNVREMQNVVQRAALLSTNPNITSLDLPIEAQTVDNGNAWVDTLPIGRPLRDVETQFILETLRHNQGNRTHAARALGISLRTLRNKINEFTAEGIQVIAPQVGRAS